MQHLRKTGGGVQLMANQELSHRVTAKSFTIKYIAAKPASRTPLSSETEIRCNRPNSASNGLSAAVAWIDPICVRSAAIFGLTACCDTTVSKIISATQSAGGVARLANVRVLSKRASRIAIPHTTPIMCIHQSAYPTIAPAESRLPNIRKAPGATTKLKNTSLPSHRLKPRNSRVRRKFMMAALYKTAAFPTTASLSDSQPSNSIKPCVLPLLNSKFSTKNRTRDVCPLAMWENGNEWWATKDLNL
jgi:hypothetical protein